LSGFLQEKFFREYCRLFLTGLQAVVGMQLLKLSHAETMLYKKGYIN